MLVEGSMCVNWLDSTTNHQVAVLRGTCLPLLNLVGKERGCEKARSRAISEGTQNAWTEQRGQAVILAGKR